MNPSVSIIIPNYNHAKYLVQRLESVFNQTYQDFEVILLDDASTDNSLEILKKYKDHEKVSYFVVNKTNSGSPFKQWKKGIELAKGKYIWIAESDDYCELNFLKLLFEKLKPNIGIAYVQSIDVDEKGNKLSSRLNYTREFEPNIWNNDFVIDGNVFLNKYLNFKNVIPNSSAVLFNKKYFTNEIFDDSLLGMKFCGDWYFWMKISINTRVLFLSNHLNYFRIHSKVSRVHNTLDKKKKRLLEENTIQLYFHKTTGNVGNFKILRYKWFNLHKFNNAFFSEFYHMKFSNESKIKFFLKFLFHNLKKLGLYGSR